MPPIRCPKCGATYAVPDHVAAELPRAIARCRCGEWLSGSRSALLARQIDPAELREIDMREYRIETEEDTASRKARTAATGEDRPRSIRVIARGADESINTVYTLTANPLWIGRRGCQVELDDAELSIRHCSITQRGGALILRDEESHTGTWLDGEAVEEDVEVTPGVHVLRVGSALVCIEPVDEAGIPVEVMALEPEEVLETSPSVVKRLLEKAAAKNAGVRQTILVCLEGSLAGQELDIPDTGLVIGREGTVRVPDDFLSRRHFEISRDPDGGARLRDLGSRNGTFLNTLPAKNSRIYPGDEIRAGANRFLVEER